MEPTRNNSSYRPSTDMFADLSLEAEDAKGVSDFEDADVAAMLKIEREEVAESRRKIYDVTHSLRPESQGESSAHNNNNTDYEPSNTNAPDRHVQPAARARPPSFESLALALQAEVLAQPALAYELTLAFIHKHPEAKTEKIPRTGNPPLHEAIMNVCEGQFLRYIPLTAMLEAGADRTTVVNDAQQTAADLVIASDNEMLERLFSLEEPNKAALINLALEYEIQELIDWLVV